MNEVRPSELESVPVELMREIREQLRAAIGGRRSVPRRVGKGATEPYRSNRSRSAEIGELTARLARRRAAGSERHAAAQFVLFQGYID